MKAKHHIAGQTVFLLARPTLPNKLVLNKDLCPSGVITIYDRDQTAIWTLTLDTTNLPPTGCLWASTLTDHASDPWWDLDDLGYTFWLALTPGRADTAAVALALVAGEAYIAKVVLQSSGNTLSWPNLADYGPVVIEFPFTFEPSPGA
jgi:hypothetical protein